MDRRHFCRVGIRAVNKVAAGGCRVGNCAAGQSGCQQYEKPKIKNLDAFVDPGTLKKGHIVDRDDPVFPESQQRKGIMQ